MRNTSEGNLSTMLLQIPETFRVTLKYRISLFWGALYTMSIGFLWFFWDALFKIFDSVCFVDGNYLWHFIRENDVTNNKKKLSNCQLSVSSNHHSFVNFSFSGFLGRLIKWFLWAWNFLTLKIMKWKSDADYKSCHILVVCTLSI